MLWQKMLAWFRAFLWTLEWFKTWKWFNFKGLTLDVGNLKYDIYTHTLKPSAYTCNSMTLIINGKHSIIVLEIQIQKCLSRCLCTSSLCFGHCLFYTRVSLLWYAQGMYVILITYIFCFAMLQRGRHTWIRARYLIIQHSFLSYLGKEV